MVYTRDETSCSSVQARTAALSGLVQYPRCVKRFLCATRAAGQVPRASHCRLRRLSPLSPGDQREIALDRSPLLVGRSAKGGADIILDDVQTPRLVSSKHAVLRFVQPDDPLGHPGPGPAGAGWEIIDLDSANGTAVNGENVRHAFLRTPASWFSSSRASPPAPTSRSHQRANRRARGSAMPKGAPCPMRTSGT